MLNFEQSPGFLFIIYGFVVPWWFFGAMSWCYTLGWSLHEKIKRENGRAMFEYFLPFSLPNHSLCRCWTECLIWRSSLPGRVQVVDAPLFSLVHWVQVLQSPQGPASRQRTPECMLGCPRRLLAIGCWSYCQNHDRLLSWHLSVWHILVNQTEVMEEILKYYT